jgi:hypothetical protein
VIPSEQQVLHRLQADRVGPQTTRELIEHFFDEGKDNKVALAARIETHCTRMRRRGILQRVAPVRGRQGLWSPAPGAPRAEPVSEDAGCAQPGCRAQREVLEELVGGVTGYRLDGNPRAMYHAAHRARRVLDGLDPDE